MFCCVSLSQLVCFWAVRDTWWKSNTYDERRTRNVEDESIWSVFPSDLCSVSHVWMVAAYHRPGVVLCVRCVGIYSECTVALCVLEGALCGVQMARHVVTGPALHPYLNIQSLPCLWFQRCSYLFLLSLLCMWMGKLLHSLVLDCVVNESHQLNAPSLCCSGNTRPSRVVVIVKDRNN